MARSLTVADQGPVTLAKVEEMSRSKRLEIPIPTARKLGLHIVDGVGGIPLFIGTEEQYQASLVHYPLLGFGTRR
ncbi:hypothetical protein KGQ31_00645 [Patescibacteria group bacterium]|nr:hypothetical protein [Patescibacteria group bacterium]